MVRLKRVYEEVLASDGYRVFVERLWPRGVRKEDAHFDEWLKEIAPSSELRTWFNHEPSRWRGFCERYKRELQRDDAKALLASLAARAERQTVTLLYAARDTERNSAVVLAEELADLTRTKGKRGSSRSATTTKRRTPRSSAVAKKP